MAEPQTPEQALLARHHYAVVDRTLLAPEQWHDNLPLQPIVPFNMNDSTRYPALLPLAELTPPQQELLCTNLREAEYTRDRVISCLFAAPDTPTPQILFHLSHCLAFRRSAQPTHLLRYYDSRVFPHLCRILTPQLLRGLFGPISVWTYLFQNEWISVTPPADIPPRSFTTTTTAEKWNQMLHIIHINEALRLWREKLDQPWAGPEEFNDASAKVDRVLQTADRDYPQLEDDAALITFSLHSLLYGEHFYRHPRIQALLHDIKQTGTHYTTATDALDEQAWLAIAVGY
jgi:hypothetical protein